MKEVCGKWCLDSACADRKTWTYQPEPVPCVYEADAHELKPVAREQHEPALVKKYAPAPRKSSRRKTLDNSRQLTFCFDVDEPVNVTPTSSPSPAQKQKRVRRTSRRKTYDDRQLMIVFDEEVICSETNKRMAA